jgi:hypothetical protein
MKTPEKSYIAARNVRPLKDFKDAKNYRDLERLGIGFDSRDLNRMAAVLFAGDSNLTAPLTVPSISTPVQFLQAWLTGFVEVMTAARRIDELVGIVVQGAWTDEEVVQGILERTGNAVPYGDQTNVPLSSWNVNFERRTIVRFEEGMKVGRLEEGRAAAMRLDSAAAKREAAGNALEIERNKIGFYGFNDGLGRTFGFLNDPSLSGYVPVPNGASGFPQWATKTFLEITADIRTAMANLRSQSQDIIDPERTDITLAIATDSVDFLTVTSDFGISVRDWLTKTYPRVRVVSAPELTDANGGDSVFYLYAESVQDSGTDDGRTWVQVVPQKFMTLGVEQQAKAYVEDYSNATAGLMLKRPYAVVRFSGI